MPTTPSVDNFILCEDARFEVTGMVTLVGFMSGALRVPTTGNLFRLCVVLVLKDMEGVESFDLTFEVSVSGEPVSRSQTVPCSRRGDMGYHTIVHTFSPFPIPRPGPYWVSAIMSRAGETQTFQKDILVEVSPPAASGSGGAGPVHA